MIGAHLQQSGEYDHGNVFGWLKDRKSRIYLILSYSNAYLKTYYHYHITLPKSIKHIGTLHVHQKFTHPPRILKIQDISYSLNNRHMHNYKPPKGLPQMDDSKIIANEGDSAERLTMDQVGLIFHSEIAGRSDTGHTGQGIIGQGMNAENAGTRLESLKSMTRMMH